VQRDLAQLSDQMRQLFPAENISVQSTGRNVVLSGHVSSKDLVEKAVNVAAGYVDKKEDVVTLLQVQNTRPATQVLLRVRFAEVSRSAMTDLGASFFTGVTGYKDNIGRLTTQQYAAPFFDNEGEPKLKFSDYLNFFLFNETNDLGLVIKALQSKGLFQSLAEPNLVAESGKDASFLAGGEFPIPVVQGTGANLAINVVFKEFGIRLNFTPEVNGDRIHLKVRPEVSTLDFGNAVLLQGFRIPALSTRRTETELELRNGQTFAISGLMNNTVSSTMSKVPGIGDIPILGYLFRSKAAQKDQTELVVMITPEILADNSRGVTPNLPRGPEQYLAPLPENKLAPVPPEAFEGARRGTSTEAAPRPSQVAGAHQPEQANPVAAVSALTSSTKTMAETADAQAPTRPTPVAEKPLTADEKKALERAKKDDEARAKERAQMEAKARAQEQKKLAAQAAAEKRAAEIEKQRQAKAAAEQARRDEEARKKAEEGARRELARQRERQRAIDDAAAELKAAQERYESVAKASR
jgi:pilus assembly protein CpaC